MNYLFIGTITLLLFSSLCETKKISWSQLEQYSFKDYIRDFERNYSPEEFQFRKQIFQSRLEEIRAHNLVEESWKKSVNQFTDKTDAERKQVLGFRRELITPVKKENLLAFPEQIDITGLPTYVDWRERGVITQVKDQGQCGSCWTFGTTETVESHWAIKTGHLFVLSEQQILDCCPNPQHCGGFGGCQGGTTTIAYEKLMELGGLTSEWMYPYISYFGENYNCHFNSSKTTPFAQLSGYQVLPSNQYSPVLYALANIGPLAINVDASVWHEYDTGVFDGCSENIDIDHVVQLVGYGTDPKFGDYWLVRNSWSPLWGENGYIRLKRNSTPKCGIDKKPQDGTGCDGGPAEITACGTCGLLYDVSYPTIKTN